MCFLRAETLLFLLDEVRRLVSMPRTWVALVVIALLSSCTTDQTNQTTSGLGNSCTTGYSSGQPVIHLSAKDNGRHVSAHVCNSIDVLLVGSTDNGWGTVQSSDEATLALVPLPHPPLPSGSTFEVFLVKRTGSAALSSISPAVTDHPDRKYAATQWAVTVTVVT